MKKNDEMKKGCAYLMYTTTNNSLEFVTWNNLPSVRERAQAVYLILLYVDFAKAVGYL